MTIDFRPDWQLSPVEQLQVELSLALQKHVPGWGGATDEQLAAVATDILHGDVKQKTMPTTEEIAELIPRLRMGGPNASEVTGQAADHIEFLEKELDRSRRALCGYAMAAESGTTLPAAAVAYHSPTVADAKRHVIDTAM